MNRVTYKINEIPTLETIVSLYEDAGWGHKDFPEMLLRAYRNSDFVVCAFSESGDIVGLGRAITDKAFTVYFPDLLVKKSWQKKGIGKEIMRIMLNKFRGFHNQVLLAEESKVTTFYTKCGFNKEVSAMSIYHPFQDIQWD